MCARLLLITALLLAAFGCDDEVDATDAGPPEIEDAGDPGVVAGRVRYEDRPYDADGFTGELVLRPSVQVRVDIVDGEGAPVATVHTDADGRFRVPVPASDDTHYLVRVLAEVEHAGHIARVTTRRDAVKTYSLEALLRPGQSADFVARHLTGTGGPFNVVDAARDAFVLYAPHVGEPASALTYRWERGRAFECGSCYGNDVISLGGQVEDTDEYDDDIILHELAHYWVEHYSRDTSPAGTHRNRQVTPELAYGEGLAYFFACMVRGTPIVVDTFQGSTRVIDFDNYLQNGEDRPGFRGVNEDGWHREEIVGGIMWDAFDAPRDEEPFDRAALGVEAQLRLLSALREEPTVDRGASGMDLSDYLHALLCEAGLPAADVQALADDRGYPYVAATACD
ncbi:MAG: hypothetical protein AB8I08_18050 [Sandaracinaceae bacterium]